MFFTVSLFITYLLGQRFYDTAVFNTVYLFLMKVRTSCVVFYWSIHNMQVMICDLMEAKPSIGLLSRSQQTFSTQNTTWAGLAMFHPHGKAQQWEVKLPPRIRSHEAHSHWMVVFAFSQSEDKEGQRQFITSVLVSREATEPVQKLWL